MLKALIFNVLEILTFLSYFFGYVEKRLDRRLKLIPKYLTSHDGEEITTMHILSNISRRKGYQLLYFSLKIMQKIWLQDQLYTSFFFFKELYIRRKRVAMATTLVLIYFGRPSLAHAIKANSETFRTIDLEICSISISRKRVWKQLLHHILCMIFQEKCLSCYFLLSDKISFSGCLYFLRYWTKSRL